MIDVVEASIAELRDALETGRTTAVELVDAYLARVDAYDGELNSIVVRNPAARAEAQASDERRASGTTLGPLDGIPYTAKDSYLVTGLTAWAQINGRDELPIPEKVALDVEYLRRRSFWFDCLILWKTAIKVLRRDGVSH